MEKALNSILSQTFKDYELIISNNASNDQTHKICKKFIQSDSRIRYYKQRKEIDALNNFNFVLQKSKGKYFMWWAHDDTRSKNFLEECVRELSSNPNIIAATCPFRFEGETNAKLIKYSLAGDRETRFKAWFKNYKRCHGIFYCLIKKTVLNHCPFLIGKKFLAIDWAIIFYVLAEGSIITTTKGVATFGLGGMSAKPNFMKTFRNHKIEYLFPYGHYSLIALEYCKKFSISENCSLLRHLIELNCSTLVLVIKSNIKDILSLIFNFSDRGKLVSK